MKPTQVQGLDNDELIEMANERREDPLIAELVDRLADALADIDRAYSEGFDAAVDMADVSR